MKLEQTILDISAQRLRELKSYHRDGTPSEKADSMRDLMALLELARLQDSGLSESAIATMIDIEAEAMKLIRRSDS